MANTPIPTAAGNNSTGLAVLAAALAALAVFLFAPQVLNDGDTYWHIAAGQWMIDHRAIPTSDVFSHSKSGTPWHAHEWLSEVLMGASYRLGGFAGLVILFGAAGAAAAGFLARGLGRSLSGLGLVVTVILTFACVAPSLLARPHILVLPLVALWTSQLLAARDQDRAPSLALALVLTLWANLHGSYVFAALVAVPLAIEALMTAKDWAGRRKVLHGWGLFGLACLAAALVTPQGITGLIFPLKVMTMTILPQIVEWRAADFSKVGPFEIVLLAGLFVCLSRGVKVPPLRLLLLLALLHMALSHERHLMMLGVVGSLVLAAPLAQALGQARPVATPLPKLPAAIAAGLALVLILGRLLVPVTLADGPTRPKTAIAALPTALKAEPVLNEYGFGGYLIFSEVAPFIDGRADMYGDDFVKRYFAMASPNPKLLDETLQAYGVQWTIFPPGHPVTALMDGKSGWRRIHADKYAVVHMHEEGAPSEMAALPGDLAAIP